MKKINLVTLIVLSLIGTANAIDSEPILKGSDVAIDSEPILRGSYVAIDSEPILKIDYVAIDSEPILRDSPKGIDSEPILKDELSEFVMVYEKNGKYVKVTYKVSKAEGLSSKEGKKRESKGQVQKLRGDKK